MIYPECPDRREDCRFQEHGGVSACMYSPIERDRNGNAVGGGMNSRSREASCSVCGKRWIETRTELEAAQGVKLDWEPIMPNAGVTGAELAKRPR